MRGKARTIWDNITGSQFLTGAIYLLWRNGTLLSLLILLLSLLTLFLIKKDERERDRERERERDWPLHVLTGSDPSVKTTLNESHCDYLYLQIDYAIYKTKFRLCIYKREKLRNMHPATSLQNFWNFFLTCCMLGLIKNQACCNIFFYLLSHVFYLWWQVLAAIYSFYNLWTSW